MLFVMNYSFRPENREACKARFKQTAGGKPPEGVKLLGQWNAISDAKGVSLFESEDPIAIAKWAQDWSDLMTIEIYPVITNENLAKLIS